jgi:L-ribulokinase
MAARQSLVVGVDYGTLSGRAVVVRVSDGAELGSAVHEYPHAVMDHTLTVGPAAESGRPVRLPPDWALQVPADYVEVLRVAVPAAIGQAKAEHGIDVADVIGVGTDFTACTMVPTTTDGTPLCELPPFADRPHAYVKLWKHHAAQRHADRINALAHERDERWIRRYGGLVSSEWELAKGLQLLEEDPDVYRATQRWVEAADWIVWQLCGAYVRNACTAGYKGLLQDGAYPSRDFLAALNPAFEDFVTAKVEHPIGRLGHAAGRLTAEAAAWTGLPEGIAVAVGNVDAHVTASAANAVEPGQMVAIMGTSTCHVMNGVAVAEVPGMCGVVDGGIVEGLWGFEAGQSGVGDIFGWFVERCVPRDYHEEARRRGLGLHEYLTELGARQAIGEHGLVALDWHSGNRSVLVDHELSGVVVGQTLATRPEDTYRALLEATAFGTRVIIESFQSSGVPVSELVVAGGLLKNRFLMQTYADVTRLPLSTIGSEQGPALGSAIHAAVAAGAYPDVRSAAASMGKVDRDVYLPDEERPRAYDGLYAEYVRLHDWFGRGGNDVMHRLRAIRRAAVAGPTAGGAAAGDSPAVAGLRAEPPTTGLAAYGPDVLAEVALVRETVAALHAELPRWGLVVWTAGNVSQRLTTADLFVIKPSGVGYDDLTPESMVVCDLDGDPVDGAGAPSSDAVAHAYVYRHMPEVGGVVHTHSTYATAWAVRGEPVPCVLTMMADEFGGPIPVGPFALVGDDSIGRGIVETLRGSRSPAVLMRGHGPFTIGTDARAAVKAAVMCEEVARTVHVARQLGEVVAIDEGDIERLNTRYQTVYGQPAGA